MLFKTLHLFIDDIINIVSCSTFSTSLWKIYRVFKAFSKKKWTIDFFLKKVAWSVQKGYHQIPLLMKRQIPSFEERMHLQAFRKLTELNV